MCPPNVNERSFPTALLRHMHGHAEAVHRLKLYIQHVQVHVRRAIISFGQDGCVFLRASLARAALDRESRDEYCKFGSSTAAGCLLVELSGKLRLVIGVYATVRTCMRTSQHMRCELQYACIAALYAAIREHASQSANLNQSQRQLESVGAAKYWWLYRPPASYALVQHCTGPTTLGLSGSAPANAVTCPELDRRALQLQRQSGGGLPYTCAAPLAGIRARPRQIPRYPGMHTTSLHLMEPITPHGVAGESVTCVHPASLSRLTAL